jgi:four helix bundle suffix protein
MRPSGGYRDTCSFQTATIIYDATVWFCEAFVDSRSRLTDQMVQAARSGRQNIAEGSRASATSSQTELRLLNVARSSLEELLLDYEDYLRHRRLRQWTPDCPEALAVRQVPRKFKADSPNLSDTSDLTDQERWTLYAPWLEHADPAVRANALICLINQANFLLDQQIASLETRFIEEGGYSEQLATARRPIGSSRKQTLLFTFRPVRNAESRPSCARRNPEKTSESSSGAAALTPTAKALLLFDGSLNAAEPSLAVTV